MKTKRFIMRVFTFIALIVLLSSSIFSSDPEDRPTVLVAPALMLAESGKLFTVNILVDPGGKSISGCSANISFDAKLIQVEKATIGDLLGEKPEIQPGYPKIDNAMGQLKIAAVCQKTLQVPEAGILYTIDFSIKNDLPPATSIIKIEQSILSDENGRDIPDIAVQNGQLRIIPLQVAEARWNPLTNIPAVVSGIEDLPADLKSGTVPLTEENIETVYKDFLNEKQSFFGVDPEQLQLIFKENISPKWHIKFQQLYQGIPVYQAAVGFTTSEQGQVISYGSNFYPDINIATKEKISLEDAAGLVKATLDPDVAKKLTQNDGAKIIYPTPEKTGVGYHLAWNFTLAGTKPNHQTDYIYIVDAANGAILSSYPLYGPPVTIYGKVQGEIYPENPTAPPVTIMPLKYAYVNLGGFTQCYTNSTGDYYGSVFGIFAPVTFKLSGRYAKVQDWGGSDYTFTKTSYGGACNYTWTATDRDHINVFYHINLLHDWYQNHCAYNWINPWDHTTQFKARVNYPVDNAYAGNPMLFGADRYARSSDVVYHECTHNVLYAIYGNGIVSNPTGNNECLALDEGFADYFACAMTNDSVEGEGTGRPRDLNNTIPYPGKLDYNYESHAGGTVIGGAAWDLRTMLIAETSTGADSTYADRLILEAHRTMAGMPKPYYFSDPQESNFLKSLYIADDDNNNLMDGVPHFPEIQRAFANHKLLQAVLNNGDRFDASTDAVGFCTGGDFYYGSNRFWANNSIQRGIKDLGDLGTPGIIPRLLEIPNQDSGYSLGVAAVVNHVYVALAQTGEEGNYIIFRVTWKSTDNSQINIEYFYANRRIKLKEQNSYDFSDQIRGQIYGGDFYLYQLKFWGNFFGQGGVIDLGNLGNLQLDRVAIPQTGYTRYGVNAIHGHTYVAEAGQNEPDYYIIFRVKNISGNDVTIDYLYRKQNQIFLYNGNSYDFSAQIRGQLSGGDFYLFEKKFWANNTGQRGVIDLGNIGNIPLNQVSIPQTGYTRFGVNAVPGRTYVALAQQGEEGSYIVFRIFKASGTCVIIDYLYITP